MALPTSLELEIVTPEGLLLREPVDEIIAPGEEGYFGVRPGHRQLVVLRQLVDAEDGDDVLQILVALQHLLDRAGHAVVLVADDPRIEDARGRGERVDGRVDAELRDGTRQVGGGVEVGERRRRRRIRVVVGRHINRLDGRDRALLR